MCIAVAYKRHTSHCKVAAHTAAAIKSKSNDAPRTAAARRHASVRAARAVQAVTRRTQRRDRADRRDAPWNLGPAQAHEGLGDDGTLRRELRAVHY